MKKFSTLKLLCALIWTCVVLSGIMLGLTVYSNKKPAPVTEVVLIEKEEPQVVMIEMSERDRAIHNWVPKMVEVRNIKNTKKLSYQEAFQMANMIANHAEDAGLTYHQAFVIVNIESDFCPWAYNQISFASGLCQVTQPCLDEFNRHNGTKYTLKDMFVRDLGLEVGFWYYSRLLTHYKSFKEYGISDLKDAYIAYNFGVTLFSKIGEWGRSRLRLGFYPCNIYRHVTGDIYTPSKRYDRIVGGIKF